MEALASHVMLLNSEKQFERRSLGSTVSRTLLVPMVMFLALLGAIIFHAERLIRTETELVHSNQVLSESQLLLRLMTDMESGLRGYLLTGSEQFLEPYRAAAPQVLRRLDALSALIQDSPQQQIEIRKLRDAYLGWHEYAEEMIALHRSGENVSETELSLAGKEQMDEMRRLREQIVAEREQFTSEGGARARRAGYGLVVVCVLAACTIFVFIAFVRRPQLVKLVEAVQKQRAQLALAAEASNLGIWYWDVETDTVESTERVRELIGVPANAEPTYKLFLQRVHPDDRARVEEAVENSIQTGSPLQIDMRVVLPDGSVRWINSRGRAFLENGRAVAMHGVVIDVSQRMEVEEALKRSELRFRALADALPQLVWTADANGRIDYVNDRWVNYTGLDLKRTTETNGIELVPPEERDFVADAWKFALDHKTELNIEFRLRRVDGEYRWFLVRAVPIFDQGNVVRWFGSCTDIEEMKRSHELLIRSEKLASTGRMAATVAHEINNPLAVITNTLYLALSDQTISEQTRSHLELAQRELVRVAHLTQQTLGFYRERSELAVVKMSDVAESVAEIFEAKLRQKQVLLVREFAQNDRIRIVEGELRQIISNLLANALDVAPDRSQITMRTNRLPAVNGKPPTVQFTLADCGPGIPREMREKIFEPFFTTKLAYGTGLGLWVTRSLTLKHSGTIRVRSPKGMGAIFSVRFPAVAEHEKDSGRTMPQEVHQQKSA